MVIPLTIILPAHFPKNMLISKLLRFQPPGVGRRRKSGVETVAVAAAVAAQAQSSSGGASGGDYWSRATYRSADADLFPNYALNYPAPLHYTGGHTGSISPSRQVWYFTLKRIHYLLSW